MDAAFIGASRKGGRGVGVPPFAVSGIGKRGTISEAWGLPDGPKRMQVGGA